MWTLAMSIARYYSSVPLVISLNLMIVLTDSDTNCWAASAMLEFFELSSEAWFLCVAVDLAITVTDPFSSPKQR